MITLLLGREMLRGDDIWLSAFFARWFFPAEAAFHFVAADSHYLPLRFTATIRAAVCSPIRHASSFSPCPPSCRDAFTHATGDGARHAAADSRWCLAMCCFLLHDSFHVEKATFLRVNDDISRHGIFYSACAWWWAMRYFCAAPCLARPHASRVPIIH